MSLLGEIVEFEGMICLRTRPGNHFPLGGNSGIAHDFCEAFGEAKPHDIGKQLHKVRGVLQMENDEQRKARIAARFDHNPDENPNWRPKVAARVYACDQCGTEKQVSTNHTGKVWAERCAGKCRSIAHPHTARETVSPYVGPHSFVREVE